VKPAPKDASLIAAFVRYLAAGLLATLVGLSVIWGAMWALGLNPFAANALGYAIALTISFQIHKFWTFGAAKTGRAGRRPARYLIAFAIAYAANLAGLALALNAFPDRAYAAQLAGMATYTTGFFLLNRFWVFPAARA